MKIKWRIRKKYKIEKRERMFKVVDFFSTMQRNENWGRLCAKDLKINKKMLEISIFQYFRARNMTK